MAAAEEEFDDAADEDEMTAAAEEFAWLVLAV